MALTKEDLLAIGELLDSKLDKKLAPINEQLDTLKTDMDAVKEDVLGLKEDVLGLKEDMVGVKEDLAELKEEGEITRGALNEVIKWTDTVARVEKIPFPLPEAK